MKVVSLVPSITETVVEMFPETSLVACTNFCVRPPKRISKSIQRVGGTKTPNHEAIKKLQPDLILLNQEENNFEDAEIFKSYTNIWVCKPEKIEDVPHMLRSLSQALEQNIDPSWQKKIEDLEKFCVSSPSFSSSSHKFPNSVYAIWRDPWMFAGGDTYIHSCMEKLGIQNILKANKRYPSFELSELLEKGVENVFLSSEPYPFKKRHQDDWRKILAQKKPAPKIKFFKIDGQIMSWYGVSSLEFLQHAQNFNPNSNKLFVEITEIS